MRRGIERYVRVLAAIAMAMAVTPVAVRAQERGGFYFGVGMGYGSLGANGCSGCDRSSGLSGHLRMGGVVSRHVLLGGESTGWVRSESGYSAGVGSLTLNTYVYPGETLGLFVKGGAGVAYTVDNADFGDAGFGWQIGTGYDIRVGTKTAVTPTFTFVRGHFDGYGTNVIQLALAFSMY